MEEQSTSSSSDYMSQQVVWNHRAANWVDWGFEEPLSPADSDVRFHEKHISPNSAALVLGATKSLCEMAVQQAQSVVSVDFAPDAISTFGVEGVSYVCKDWIGFLQENSEKYDNIITDNGLCCIEFPGEWTLLSQAIQSSLKPGGVFSMRAFVSSESSSIKTHYENPNLQRIIPFIGRAAASNDWTVVKPADGQTNLHPARYVFPSSEVVEQTFSELTLVEKMTPDYEEGGHFVSFAFQKQDSSS